MTDRQTAPGNIRRDDRPPIPSDSAPSPGAVGSVAVRRTAMRRPTITPLVWDVGPQLGVPASHPYVRTFWTPVIGPGAVADLLRLATAASRGRSLPRPLHIATLVTHGLVHATAGDVRVRLVIPYLDAATEALLHPRLKRDHRLAIRTRSG